MKKLLLPMLIALTLVMTISSCEKEPEDLGKDMYGTYNGKFQGDLRVLFAPVVTIDTTFEAPGVEATGILASTTYEDSLSLNVKVTVDGTPIDITVLGHIDSKTAFTVPPTIVNYLGAVPILVSGSGTITGNVGDVQINLKESDGTTDAIYGDLTFSGSK